MLQPATLTFLKNLAANNDKTWFDEHRKEYETAKKDHEQYVDKVLAELCKEEEGFKGQKAKDCVFRIFRDVRFSKNKAPYKANFGAVFSKGGKKHLGAGYYVHLEPGKSFIGGGIWQPEADVLKKIRQEIDYNFTDFQNILKNKDFKKLFREVDGERLKKAPQGYEEGNPAIEFLKLKSFTVGTALKDEDFTGKNLVKKTLDVFYTMRPFIDFLNTAVE